MPGSGLRVVLVEPEIPPNTGNIARTCAATGIPLHLVGKLGFELSDRYLKRAGLDYWEHVDLHYHPRWPDLTAAHPRDRFVLTTARGGIRLWDFQFQPGDWLVFGSESHGLGEAILAGGGMPVVTIPMTQPAVRSLNLSNAVAVVLFEALRQLAEPHSSS